MSDGLVAGRFRLRGLLGSGGTAAVFHAHDTREGRDVALKLLHPHLARDSSLRVSFFEEVRAAQSVTHPALVEILDAGVHELDLPVLWIALELVPGVTLADHVRDNGPLSPDAAIVFADALLAGLAAAHDGGIVHRDVSPGNIMLDARTVADPVAFAAGIRLLDFGLADVPGRTTRGADALLSGASAPAGIVATVPYASPEQLTGGALAEPSDVYQAGATLFFALTGAPPFLGDQASVTRAHLAAPPPVPSARRRGIARGWDRVITTALLKDPNDRYANAADMRAALRSTGAAVDATPRAVDAGDARSPDPATAVTRAYRTQLPSSAPWSPPEPPPGAGAPVRRGRARWPAWVAGCVGAGVIVGVVALSSAAGSAPSAVPTSRTSDAAVPTAAAPSAPVPTPVAPVAPVLRGVPDVVGLSSIAARARLAEAALAVGAITTQDSPHPSDTVLATDPPAGDLREAGESVALRVASGANSVPAVGGLPLPEAAAALAAAGFVAVVGESGGGVTGFVELSVPAAGTSTLLGSTVMLTMTRPATPSPSPTPTAAPPPLPTPSPTG